MNGMRLNKFKHYAYTIIVLACLNNVNINYANADPLSPDKAFNFIGKVENNSVVVYGTTQPSYNLYKDSIKILNNKSNLQLGNLIKPAGKRQYNEFLNKYQEEYEGDFLLEIPILDKKKGVIEFDIESQGCTQGLCYSPFITHIKLIRK